MILINDLFFTSNSYDSSTAKEVKVFLHHPPPFFLRMGLNLIPDPSPIKGEGLNTGNCRDRQFPSVLVSRDTAWNLISRNSLYHYTATSGDTSPDNGP